MGNPDISIEAKLLAEQLARYQDRFEAHLKSLETQISHNQAMNLELLVNLRSDMQNLHNSSADHETRIRSLTDSAVTFRTWSALFSGSSLIAASVALIRSLFGK
jgi:hypothetical protein